MGVQTQLTENVSGNLELGILQFNSEGPMFYFKENYFFQRFQKGFHRFPRGLDFFRGVGVKLLISIETYRTYDFPGGGGQALSHLRIRACTHFLELKFILTTLKHCT